MRIAIATFGYLELVKKVLQHELRGKGIERPIVLTPETIEPVSEDIGVHLFANYYQDPPEEVDPADLCLVTSRKEQEAAVASGYFHTYLFDPSRGVTKRDREVIAEILRSTPEITNVVTYFSPVEGVPIMGEKNAMIWCACEDFCIDDPRRVLLIDDDPDNCTAARRAGYHAYEVKYPDQGLTDVDVDEVIDIVLQAGIELVVIDADCTLFRVHLTAKFGTPRGHRTGDWNFEDVTVEEIEKHFGGRSVLAEGTLPLLHYLEYRRKLKEEPEEEDWRSRVVLR